MTRWTRLVLWAAWWPFWIMMRGFVGLFTSGAGIARAPGDQPDERRRHWIRIGGVVATALIAVIWVTGALLAGKTGIEKGSGTFVVERRPTPAFSRMVVTNDQFVIVVIDPDAEPLVIVTMDDNLMPLVRSRVSNDTLRIDSTEPINRTLGTVIRVQAPSLDRILVSDRSIVQVRGVDTANFEVDARKGSDVEVDGRAETVVIRSDSSRVETWLLLTPKAQLDIHGSSTINVYAGSEITGVASGDAEVRVSGGAPLAQISMQDGAVACSSGDLALGVAFSCRY